MTTRPQCLPVAVVGGQWVGDVASGHQEESTHNMPGTADREEDEGGPEADPLLIKQLQKKEEDSQHHSQVLGNTVHNIQTAGAKPVSICRLTGKGTVACTDDGTAFTPGKSRHRPQHELEDTRLKEVRQSQQDDGLPRPGGAQSRPSHRLRKENVLVGGWRGWTGSHCLMGTEFQFCKVAKSSGDGEWPWLHNINELNVPKLYT